MATDLSGPGDDRVNRPFVGIPTLLRAPVETDLTKLDADIAVLGVPTDEGSPFMAGSRFAPRALREHSMRLAFPDGYWAIESGKQYLTREMRHRRIVDVGDSDILPTNVEKTFDNITRDVKGILAAGAMPVVMGGDHAITYPVVRAYPEDQPLWIFHFDAHIDYAPFIHDLRFTNAHAFRLIQPLPQVQSIVQAGIRSLRTTEQVVADSRGAGNEVFTMADFRATGPEGLAHRVPKDARCYVSIDVDALDISLVPGCVSAEPNGMTYAELRDSLEAIAHHADVGGDARRHVELRVDFDEVEPDYIGAHTMVEFLGFICDQPRWRQRHPD